MFPMMITEDVLWRIAEFLEPDLLMLIRLSAVNRVFYTVFTSDKMWSYANPYEVQKDIFRSYQVALNHPLDSKLLRFYWSNGDKLAEPLTIDQLKSLTTNHFVWLGYAMRHFSSLDKFSEYPNVVTCAVETKLRDKSVYEFTSTIVSTTKEWALKLIPLRPELLYSFSKYWSDPEVIKAAASGDVTNYDYDPCLKFGYKRAIRNSPIGELATRSDPRNIQFLGDETREGFVRNRSWVLDALEKFPDLIANLREYRDDDEAAARAYNNSIKCLQRYSHSLEGFSERIRQSREICRKAVTQSPYNIEFSLSKDLDLLKSALGEVDGLYRCPEGFPKQAQALYGSELKNDLEACVLLTATCGERVFKEDFAESLLSSGEILLTASKTPSASCLLSGLPERYIEDPDFVVQVLDRLGAKCWKYISEDMKRDRAVALKGLECGVPIDTLETYVGPIFSSDREMVKLSAQCTDQTEIFKTPEAFADDDEIIAIAVSKRGCALQYASDRLRGDPTIALKALDMTAHKQAGNQCVCRPYKYISSDLLRDLDFLESAVRISFACPAQYLVNESIALLAMESNPHYYMFLPQKLKNSIEFNISAAQRSAGTLKFMTDEMRSNRKVLETANFEYKAAAFSYCCDCFE